MKCLLVFIAAFALYSCTTQANPDINLNDYENLKYRVTILETRVDSLVSVMQEKAKPKSSKKGKKNNSSVNSTTSSNASYLSSGSSSSYKSSSYSGRCQATTKKGYQCSRSARSRGYCWQHGG